MNWSVFWFGSVAYITLTYVVDINLFEAIAAGLIVGLQSSGKGI